MAADPLKSASTHLENAIKQLAKSAKPPSTKKLGFTARLRVLFTGRAPKPAAGSPNPDVELIYDECRDIYTRLAGLCADAELAG